MSATAPQAGALRQAPLQLRQVLFGALALMVVLRLLPVLFMDVQPTSDPGWYLQRAIGILQTGRYAENGVTTAFWPVGYPGFLAGLMAVFGTSVLAAQLGNLALSVVCALLMYQWCLRQFDDERVATTAVVLLAVYPNHIGYTIGLYSEPLFTALLLAVCVLLSGGGGKSWLNLVLAGVLAGLGALVKSQMLILPPVLVLLSTVDAWSWSQLRPALGRAVLVTGVMAATIAPWTWRNYVELGAFIPVSANGGMSLLAGNNAEMTFSLRTDFVDDGPIFKQVNFSVADQVNADRRARAAAWSWIRANPDTFLLLMPKKFIRLWLPDGESEWNLQRGYANYAQHELVIRAVRIANQVFYFAVLAGMLWALRATVRWRDPRTLVVPMLVAYFTCISLVFSGQSRYHAPLMPFALVLCAWTLVRFRRSR